MILEELTKLATQTSMIVVILLVLGVIFCFIESIISGFGFFGITGILMVIAGIVIHAVYSGSAIQVIFILVVLSLIFALIILVFIRSAKYGLLAKLSVVENKTALPLNYDQVGSNEIKSLIGKKAKTVTECRPIGKIDVNGIIYEASTKNDYLKSDVEVLITDIEGNLIYIEKYIKGDKK